MSLGCESGGEGGNSNDIPSITAFKESLPAATMSKIKTFNIAHFTQYYCKYR